MPAYWSFFDGRHPRYLVFPSSEHLKSSVLTSICNSGVASCTLKGQHVLRNLFLCGARRPLSSYKWEQNKCKKKNYMQIMCVDIDCSWKLFSQLFSSMNVFISLLPDLCSTTLFFVLSAQRLCIYFDFFYTFIFHLLSFSKFFWRFLIHLDREQNSVVLPVVYINIFTLVYRNVKFLTASSTKAA